eukprot:1450586-Rhodomonas_salina.5
MGSIALSSAPRMRRCPLLTSLVPQLGEQDRAWETRWAGLGETLEGNSLVKSDYAIKFKKNIAVASCAFAMRSPVLMLALLLPGADCRVLNEGG